MSDSYDSYSVYGPVARKIMRVLQPYEKYMDVPVKQDDSLCLYLTAEGGDEPELFAAVQVLRTGVRLTVYDPGADYHIFDRLPPGLMACYQGGNRFLFTRMSTSLLNAISRLLPALYGVYSLRRYFMSS